MYFEYYDPVKENGSCIVRTCAKLLNKDLNIICDELNDLAKELNYDNYKEIEVFEKYLFNNKYEKIVLEEEILVKDLKLDYGKYAIFCYDKKDYYHIAPIINNVLYDKNEKCLNLYVISIYKFV